MRNILIFTFFFILCFGSIIEPKSFKEFHKIKNSKTLFIGVKGKNLNQELSKGIESLLKFISKLQGIKVVLIKEEKFPEFIKEYQDLGLKDVSKGPIFLIFRYGIGKQHPGPYQIHKLIQYLMNDSKMKQDQDLIMIGNEKNEKFKKLSHILQDEITSKYDSKMNQNEILLKSIFEIEKKIEIKNLKETIKEIKGFIKELPLNRVSSLDILYSNYDHYILGLTSFNDLHFLKDFNSFIKDLKCNKKCSKEKIGFGYNTPIGMSDHLNRLQIDGNDIPNIIIISKDKSYVMNKEKYQKNYKKFWKDYLKNNVETFIKSESENGNENDLVLKLTRHKLDSLKNQNILIKFWRKGCPHCTILEPIYEQIAKEFQNSNILITKFNTDLNTTPKDFNIQFLPTIILVNCKNEKFVFQGQRTFQEISNFVHKNKC